MLYVESSYCGPLVKYKEILSKISKNPKIKTENIFEVTFLIEKIIFFILVFFCDLENTYTFIKTSSERWIAPATPPSRPCETYMPVYNTTRVVLSMGVITTDNILRPLVTVFFLRFVFFTLFYQKRNFDKKRLKKSVKKTKNTQI